MSKFDSQKNDLDKNLSQNISKINNAKSNSNDQLDITNNVPINPPCNYVKLDSYIENQVNSQNQTNIPNITNNLNNSKLNESSICLNDSSIYKFKQNELNLSYNMDDSLRQSFINQLDASTNSTLPDINDLNLQSQTKEEDTKTNIDKSEMKMNDQTKILDNIEGDDVDLDEEGLDANGGENLAQNKSVLEISLDSVKNQKRVDEIVDRKKVPSFLSIDLKLKTPKITKSKHILNFKSEVIDYKTEFDKFLYNNNYETRMVADSLSEQTAKHDLHSVIKSMEQRLLQFGKLAPIADIGRQYDEESNSEEDLYNLNDGLIDDGQVDQDCFSDEDEASFLVQLDPKAHSLPGDCLDDLIKFNTKCITRKARAKEKARKNKDNNKFLNTVVFNLDESKDNHTTQDQRNHGFEMIDQIKDEAHIEDHVFETDSNKPKKSNSNTKKLAKIGTLDPNETNNSSIMLIKETKKPKAKRLSKVQKPINQNPISSFQSKKTRKVDYVTLDDTLNSKMSSNSKEYMSSSANKPKVLKESQKDSQDCGNYIDAFMINDLEKSINSQSNLKNNESSIQIINTKALNSEKSNKSIDSNSSSLKRKRNQSLKQNTQFDKDEITDNKSKKYLKQIGNQINSQESQKSKSSHKSNSNVKLTSMNKLPNDQIQSPDISMIQHSNTTSNDDSILGIVNHLNIALEVDKINDQMIDINLKKSQDFTIERSIEKLDKNFDISEDKQVDSSAVNKLNVKLEGVDHESNNDKLNQPISISDIKDLSLSGMRDSKLDEMYQDKDVKDLSYVTYNTEDILQIQESL